MTNSILDNLDQAFEPAPPLLEDWEEYLKARSLPAHRRNDACIASIPRSQFKNIGRSWFLTEKNREKFLYQRYVCALGRTTTYLVLSWPNAAEPKMRSTILTLIENLHHNGIGFARQYSPERAQDFLDATKANFHHPGFDLEYTVQRNHIMWDWTDLHGGDRLFQMHLSVFYEYTRRAVCDFIIDVMTAPDWFPTNR